MRSTVSALAGGAALGFDFDGMLEVIKALTTAEFYKSMTTNSDHRVWQDVYHGQWGDLSLYIKFQRASEYFVVSFKEL